MAGGIIDSNSSNDSDYSIVELRGPSGNAAEVTAEGEVKISSFANLSFVDGNRTINTTEIVANVSGTNLANRKSLIIYNRGAQDIFYGTTGVSDTTGIAIAKEEVVSLEIGENINIYLVTKTGVATATIQEFA